MLVCDTISSGYGAVVALRDVSLEVRQGEIVTLIGANGAGKSTLLMTLCGKPRAWSGRIHFQGQDITHRPMHEVVRLGIAHAPEGRRIFPRLTVQENLQLGAYGQARRHYADDVARVYDLFPRLSERTTQRGGTLSGGEQQMLAIGRALMARPSLLLLDEPSLGLAPILVAQIFDALRAINRDVGTTILLVEQNAHQALRLCHRGYVLVNGRITLSGTGADLLTNPLVRSAYLDGHASLERVD